MSRLSSFLRRRSWPDCGRLAVDAAASVMVEAIHRTHLPKSTLFFTHHKCASTFVHRLLSRLQGKYGGVRTMDYSGVLWKHSARLAIPKPVDDLHVFEHMSDELFRERGFVYGPLRGAFSLGHDSRFNRILFIRDPRDTLVSMYHSMACTHPVPPDPERAKKFLAVRDEARRGSIDAFVLAQARSWLKPLLSSYREIVANASDPVAVFRYEDFVADPVSNVSRMLDSISGGAAGGPTPKSILQGETFVRPAICTDHHQRSGAAGQYQKELAHSTIVELDRLFEKELAFFWATGTQRLRRAA